MKKILALMGAVLLLSVSARAVEVSAPSALLMEKETGTVLFAKNEHEKLEPASVTKIMTLLLTMEAIDGGTLRYEDTVTASPHACSMGGSQIWLKEGERLTVDEMLKAVCVVSANDCAVALADITKDAPCPTTYRVSSDTPTNEADGSFLAAAAAWSIGAGVLNLPPLRIPASKVHIVPQGKPGTNIIERYVLDDALTLDDITYNGDGSVASLRVRKRDGSVITWQAS